MRKFQQNSGRSSHQLPFGILISVILFSFFNPDEAPIDPDPCFVRNSMAWLIDFPLQMQSSHKAVEQFYRNVTHCKLNLTVQVITNPDDVIDFEFY